MKRFSFKDTLRIVTRQPLARWKLASARSSLAVPLKSFEFMSLHVQTEWVNLILLQEEKIMRGPGKQSARKRTVIKYQGGEMTLEKNEKISSNVAVQWHNIYFSLALDRKALKDTAVVQWKVCCVSQGRQTFVLRYNVKGLEEGPQSLQLGPIVTEG